MLRGIGGILGASVVSATAAVATVDSWAPALVNSSRGARLLSSDAATVSEAGLGKLCTKWSGAGLEVVADGLRVDAVTAEGEHIAADVCVRASLSPLAAARAALSGQTVHIDALEVSGHVVADLEDTPPPAPPSGPPVKARALRVANLTAAVSVPVSKGVVSTGRLSVPVSVSRLRATDVCVAGPRAAVEVALFSDAIEAVVDGHPFTLCLGEDNTAVWSCESLPVFELLGREVLPPFNWFTANVGFRMTAPRPPADAPANTLVPYRINLAVKGGAFRPPHAAPPPESTASLLRTLTALFIHVAADSSGVDTSVPDFKADTVLSLSVGDVAGIPHMPALKALFGKEVVSVLKQRTAPAVMASLGALLSATPSQ